MVGTLEIAGAVAIGLLAVVGTAYVLVSTDDVSGGESRLSGWVLVAAMVLFVGLLLWSLWTVA